MSLIISRAGMDVLPETHALIREAADWLIAKGEPLWGPNETSYEDLCRVTSAGELVIGREGRELAACMFLHNEDSLFWPHTKHGEAFYIHRLAVARKFAGRFYARAMLDWAAAEAMSKGRFYLRLDCEPRPKLLALYKTEGFIPIDPKPIQVGPHFVVRHEKPLAVLSRSSGNQPRHIGLE